MIPEREIYLNNFQEWQRCSYHWEPTEAVNITRPHATISSQIETGKPNDRQDETVVCDQCLVEDVFFIQNDGAMR